ncbi:MAG: Asp23/Gls24 family envelope stress response protein, partial [Erysipelotrichaceae bacterium]|nr:Asp23/Gls24 family envelope stress response protein [Erysipelotrichaceae bacterium]
LKKENYAKGVKVKTGKNGTEIDLHVVLSEGVRIATLVPEIQKRVKYILEKNLDVDITAVNVHIMGIKVSK